MDFKKEILQILENYSKKEDLAINWSISQSNDLNFGHFSVALFPVAKAMDKDLDQAFQDLLQFINEDYPAFLAKIEFLKGFVNFYIKEDLWQGNFLNKIINDELIEKNVEDFKVMIEYSSPNPGKSFHIGHLRNTLIGLVVANLYKAEGINIQTANYLNDTGLHIAKLVWYLQNKTDEPVGDIEDWLAKIYAEVSQLAESEPGINDEIRELYQKIEAGDEAAWLYINKIKDWSLDNFKKIYSELGASFDSYSYDSEVLELGKNYVEELLQKGIAYKDDGAIIVNLEEYGLTNALILKSDGSALYITKDLALAKKRFEMFDIHKLIYVVGVEQKLHFQQIFKILELDGFKQAKQCEHLAYELVDLPGGKMSSRQGNVVTYRHLRDEVVQASLLEVKARYAEETEAWQKALAEKIALAALKVWILKYDNTKKILFKVEDALDFQGDTGPYLLYTVARLNSLFKKADINESILHEKCIPLEDENSQSLYRAFYSFAEMLHRARREGRPSILTNYLLDLAKLLNHYYHEHPILKAETEELGRARSALLWSGRVILEKGLSILAVDTVERM